MAPHALQDPHDSTGYTPSLVNYAKLLPHVRVHSKLKVSTPIRAVVTSNDAFDEFTAEESKSAYFRHLSLEEIRDVEASMNHFQSLKLPLHAISQETFPVSESLRAKLKDVTRAVYGEHQFLIISGLDTSQYNDFENVIIHAGLSSHVGSKRGMPGREGGDSTVLNHIIAMLASPKGSTEQYHAPPNQARDIPFHTDNGDIVSLFTISASESGGSFYLADSTAVYKELKALKPKLARALVDDWTMVSPSASKDYDFRPIVFPQHESGRVLINCSRARITGTPCAPRPASLPALTKTQRHAIDALHILAMSRAIEIQLQPGDMIFFNNLTLMHARDAFVDNGAEGQKRHLLRLILRNEEAAYKLPRQLAETWEALYEHDVEEEKFPVKKELFTWACSH